MKKVLALLLTLTMLLSIAVPTAFAAEAAPEGEAIRSAAALKRMDPEGTYYLAGDIIIHGSWRYDEFRGTLDGNGHTIYFDHAEINGGLFAVLGKKDRVTTTIKNLNIVELEEVTYVPTGAEGEEAIGGLAAQVALGITYIDNVHVYANLSASRNRVSVGGLVGDARYTSLVMSNCSFSGSINHVGGGHVSENSVGGMLGKTWSYIGSLVFMNCVNYGDLTTPARAGGIFGYDYPKDTNSDQCIKELVISGCVNYGKITGTLNESLQPNYTDTDNGVGGIFGHHISYANTKTTFINNVNYGEVRANYANIAGGIGGHYQAARDTKDSTTLVIMGNVNYGVVKTVDGTKNGYSIIGLYRTTTGGGISEHASRIYNMNDAANGMVEVTLPDPFPQKTESRLTGTNFTNTNETLTTLNTIFPDTYALVDGKIGLKWAADAGFNANYKVDRPALDDIETATSAVDKTAAVTLDVTVPAATGTAITNQAELAAMTSDGVYYLANDILITGEFKPIENFSGVLHGNDKAIVLNGAEFRGGLFSSLAGGKVYNLSITEEKTKNVEENIYRGYQINADTLGLGTLAAYGYGTIVNVTVDCAVGGMLKSSASAYVGGLIGVVTDGDTIIYNCINLAKVQGGYAGGLVGLVIGGEGKTEISRCANWGAVVASVGCSGGIVGLHAASALRLLVSENVNYGNVTTSASEYAGGIIGVQKNLWDGIAIFTNNVNYGKISATGIKNLEGVESNTGCAGGIMGCCDADSFAGVIVSGNVNYGAANGNLVSNQIVGQALNCDGFVTAENNYAAGTGDATIGAITVPAADANTLAALNAVYANVYAAQGEQIGLKWAVDQGYSTTAPVVAYSLGGEDTNNDKNDNQKDEQQTTATTTEDKTATEPAPAKKGGCGSVVSGFGFMALLALVGAAYCLVDKKRKITD